MNDNKIYEKVKEEKPKRYEPRVPKPIGKAIPKEDPKK